jgi:arginine repressor
MQSIIMDLDKTEIEIYNKTISRETQDLHLTRTRAKGSGDAGNE